MNVLTSRRLPDEAARVADLVPWMQQLATKGDAEAAFPKAELEALRQAAILAIPLPKEAPYWAGPHGQTFWHRHSRSLVVAIFPSAGWSKPTSTHGISLPALARKPSERRRWRTSRRASFSHYG